MIAFNEGIIHVGPEPLSVESPNNDYPLDALGDVLAPMAKALHTAIQAPISLCGQSVLMSAALVAQGMKNIQMPHGEYPLSLFGLTIAISGERKTAVDKLAMSPIKAHEKRRQEDYTVALAEYKLKDNAFREAEKLAKKRLPKDASISTIEHGLRSIGYLPMKPTMPTLTASDATIEGVVKHFKEALPVLGLYSSEGGTFFGGYSMGRENVTKTVALFSQAWDGDPLDMMRSDPLTGTFKLYNRRLSISLMVQPVIAHQALSDPLLVGQGFIPRFLLCEPDSAMGTRLYNQIDIGLEPGYKYYYKRMSELLEQGFTINDNNELELFPLTVTDDAMHNYIQFHDEVEKELSANGSLRHISGTGAKIAEQALRISGVLTVIKFGKEAFRIAENEMQAGIMLARYSLNELLRIEQQANIPRALNDAIKLLDWISEKRLTVIFAQKIQQLAPNSLRKADRYLPAIQELIERGYMMRVEGGQQIDGRHRKDVWQVLHYQKT